MGQSTINYIKENIMPSNNQVKLTSREFLSVYTGYLLADSMDIVYETISKVYDFNAHTHSLITFADHFCDYIDTYRPDLAKAVKDCGEIDFDNGEDVHRQINNYISKFNKTIGSNRIVVDKLLFSEVLNTL